MAASLSQPLESYVVPATAHDDPEPVKTSLSQAREELSRGQIREALRHLRRAAEGADEAGSELRAVALARAAADLATAAGGSLVPPAEKGPSVVSASSVPVSAVRANADQALRQLLESGRAVKVVVKRSARDESLYVVRRAEAGGSLGAREAVIVLLEPDDGFFAARLDEPKD
jgi:hypothetical protein